MTFAVDPQRSTFNVLTLLNRGRPRLHLICARAMKLLSGGGRRNFPRANRSWELIFELLPIYVYVCTSINYVCAVDFTSLRTARICPWEFGTSAQTIYKPAEKILNYRGFAKYFTHYQRSHAKFHGVRSELKSAWWFCAPPYRPASGRIFSSRLLHNYPAARG